LPPLARPVAADVQLPERRVTDDRAERRQALLEDLAAMGDEQQRRVTAEVGPQPAVVQRREHEMWVFVHEMSRP
jgi:hypothetical protein